jgi:hypothetical protein
MSAIIGVCDRTTVHMLTNGASTNRKDGRVALIHQKQVTTRYGAVVAGMGLWSPALRFAELADKHANSFDELVAVTPTLMDGARPL